MDCKFQLLFLKYLAYLSTKVLMYPLINVDIRSSFQYLYVKKTLI